MNLNWPRFSFYHLPESRPETKTSLSYRKGSVVKNLTANALDARDTGSILGQEDPLEEEEMAAHSSNPMDRGGQ